MHLPARLRADLGWDWRTGCTNTPSASFHTLGKWSSSKQFLDVVTRNVPRPLIVTRQISLMDWKGNGQRVISNRAIAKKTLEDSLRSFVWPKRPKDSQQLSIVKLRAQQFPGWLGRWVGVVCCLCFSKKAPVAPSLARLSVGGLQLTQNVGLALSAPCSYKAWTVGDEFSTGLTIAWLLRSQGEYQTCLLWAMCNPTYLQVCVSPSLSLYKSKYTSVKNHKHMYAVRIH